MLIPLARRLSAVCAASFLVLLALASIAQAQDPQVPQIAIEGRMHVFVPQLASRYGVEVDWNPAAGICILKQEQRVVEGRLSSARWLIDGRFFFGTGALREYLDVPVIVADDVGAVLSGVLGREVPEDEIRALLGSQRFIEEDLEAIPVTPVGIPAVPHVEKGARLENVRSIPYPRYTRLVLTFSGAVDYNIRQDRARRLQIELSDVNAPDDPGPLDIGDAVLETVGWRTAGDGVQVTVLTMQDTAEYDAYYLEEPVRLILDFQKDTAEPPMLLAPSAPGQVVPQAPEQSAIETAPAPLATIVIDPGHGGRDPGAQGEGGLFEKEVTLAIAQELKDRLERDLDLRVVLTRSGDYFVSLAERTEIANTANGGAPADLFISIHLNSIKSVRAGGFETYFVSEAVDPSAEATAALENSSALDVSADDPQSELLRRVLWDLQFSAFVEESNEFAVLAQEAMGERLSIENRGVKQAPFLVLSGCAMPAVLIEAGFISNRAEEIILQTPEFQKDVAAALTRAVAEFKARRERRLGLVAGGQS